MNTGRLPWIWEKLLAASSDEDWRRERWRLLRQGILPDSLAENRGVNAHFDLPVVYSEPVGHAEPNRHADAGWCWTPDMERSSEDGQVCKLRLRSARWRDACETVVMRPRKRRATVCVSTQVGCAVGCRFCATGRMGLLRNLDAIEILEQVLLARLRVRRWAECSTPESRDAGRISRKDGIHLRNVVFMGMGEPLHNWNSLVEALDVLLADQGFGFSPRHVTVSTAGVPGKMVSLARTYPRLRIALSLHSAVENTRRMLVPRATHDLQSLQEAIRIINQIDPEGPVWLEIALIEGVNDSLREAQAVVDFCQGLRVEVNVIPFNDISHASTHELPMAAPSLESRRAYVRHLREFGLFTTLRNTLGGTIQAACGQLIV
ncbi:MAG: radical SAM protein [Planctomycetes bacterium]|nr:radical SAM protein [Planctomycetota bacterium]